MSEKTSNSKCGLIPHIITAIVAISGILSGVFIATYNSKIQTENTKFQVTFIEKQKSYVIFMGALTNTYYSAMDGDKIGFTKNEDNLELAYFGIEPFINSEKTKDKLWDRKQEFEAVCTKVLNGEITKYKSVDQFISYRHFFRKILQKELFEDIPIRD